MRSYLSIIALFLALTGKVFAQEHPGLCSNVAECLAQGSPGLCSSVSDCLLPSNNVWTGTNTYNVEIFIRSSTRSLFGQLNRNGRDELVIQNIADGGSILIENTGDQFASEDPFITISTPNGTSSVTGKAAFLAGSGPSSFAGVFGGTVSISSSSGGTRLSANNNVVTITSGLQYAPTGKVTDSGTLTITPGVQPTRTAFRIACTFGCILDLSETGVVDGQLAVVINEGGGPITIPDISGQQNVAGSGITLYQQDVATFMYLGGNQNIWVQTSLSDN